jgi:hypothetical protein
MDQRTRAGLVFAVAVFALVLSLTGNAQADDWTIYRHQDPYAHIQFHDTLGARAVQRAVVHQDAHRYPMTWQQHERLHDALDHAAYHDYLADREFHRSYDYSGGYYNTPANLPYLSYGSYAPYPSYAPYGSYAPYPAYAPYGGYAYRPFVGSGFRAYGGYINQPYGVSNFRPFSSRFGLYSPRWGVMYNGGY